MHQFYDFLCHSHRNWVSIETCLLWPLLISTPLFNVKLIYCAWHVNNNYYYNNFAADLLSPPDLDGLCLRCHYVHSQHFPDLRLTDYTMPIMPRGTSPSLSPSLSSSTAPSLSLPSTERCSFCSEPFRGHLSAVTQPLPSGLASLREMCAVREPQTELECLLISQWITGIYSHGENIYQ